MRLPSDRARVLGIRIDPVTTPDVLRAVRSAVTGRQPCHIITVNVEFIMLARRDPGFRDVIEGAGLATADSAGVLWALRRQDIDLPYRVGGSDLIWSLCLQAEEFGHRVFLLGGGEGVAAAAARRLQQAYPRLQVAGTYAGSPAAEDEESIVHLIRRSQADILFVAFGAPQQDIWIALNLERTGAACALGVGGSLDYIAGTAQRAPVWMREHNLDWLWRLIRQPWRWRRMLVLPVFAWLVLRGEGRRDPERINV
jgi:N-acetylglucosaminyldiphosphoundecaprenol N-acetyl-beta-D-mannosaminyltransferase